MRTHELKCWPKFFRAIKRGEKRAELRKDDRGFGVGDVLVLREFDPWTSIYSGEEIRVPVTHLVMESQFGLIPGFVIMSLGEPLEKGVPR